MKLSDLQIGDAVVIEGEWIDSTPRIGGSMRRRCQKYTFRPQTVQVVSVLSKSIVVSGAKYEYHQYEEKEWGQERDREDLALEERDSTKEYRFSMTTGKQLQQNSSGNWEVSGKLQISIPTSEEMETLPGYKGNSIATSIRKANEQTISELLKKMEAFLDQDSPEFSERVLAVKDFLGSETVEGVPTNYAEEITRLETENRRLLSKLSRIVAIAGE